MSLSADLGTLGDFCRTQLDEIYTTHLKTVPAPTLQAAMRLALENRGKQLRPMLVYATASLLNADLTLATIPAAAIELIHTYSLIHDDLPSMDNADLRRGKPTIHKAYGEAIAILTGDAMQNLANHIVAQHSGKLSTEKRLQMITSLNRASGHIGMVSGQAMDLEMTEPKSKETLLLMYRLKTGALINCSIELGYLAASHENENPHTLDHLLQFSERIGLAFQIQDDILDIEGKTAILGKKQGIDSKNKKITYPDIVGLSAAKEKVKNLYNQALNLLDSYGTRASLLTNLLKQMLLRQN